MRRLSWAAVCGMAIAVAFATDSGAETIRGITLSTHGSGRDWGGDQVGPTLGDLRDVGAGWVAIHPYARIDDDGRVRFRRFDPEHPPAELVRPIAEAHDRGMKILIKPHLGYWGSRFSWRGAIDFETEEEWGRFFASYREWIQSVAAATRAADGFCVGTELDRTIDREREWREVIAAVRAATRVPLCYAANWSDYERVPFWDALDVIGIQAYFPVTEAEHPSQEDLERGWDEILARVRRFSLAYDRHVVFTELGYNRSLRAAVAPWEYRSEEGPEAEALQAACLEVALAAIEQEPRVIGAFLWKWFPRPHPVGRNFQLATPRLIESIQRVWQ